MIEGHSQAEQQVGNHGAMRLADRNFLMMEATTLGLNQGRFMLSAAIISLTNSARL
jgi:hypothetical protein